MNESALRDQLVKMLDGNQAHLTFDAATDGLAVNLRGQKPPGLTHTPWRLVEHLRIAQRDILDYCLDPAYVAPEWPAAYWPQADAPHDDLAWDRTLKALRDDLQSIKNLVVDPAIDLFAPIPWGGEHTILREVLLVADHNSYHVGQLILVRKLLKNA